MPHLPRWAALALALGFTLPAYSAVTASLNGDLRLRYENDWDSHTAAGTLRADRERGRVRARLQGTIKFSPEWSFVARARTGHRHSQQSPHLTFWSSDDVTDDASFVFDRYAFLFKDATNSVSVGRNSVPFWQQNEFVFDDDVTPTGASFTHDLKTGGNTVSFAAGAFLMPDGADELNGSMLGAQAKFTRAIEKAQLTLAAGLYRMDGDNRGDRLRNRNGARDYLLGVASAQYAFPLASAVPLALGIDLIRNFEDYSVADAAPFAPFHADETNGWVLSAVLGQLKKARDWQAGYYYARIETFAVNAAYTQDDWARFGSATQSDLTDIKGHELRAAYAITANLNVMARLFLVDAITSRQDGNRFRCDLNWKF